MKSLWRGVQTGLVSGVATGASGVLGSSSLTYSLAAAGVVGVVSGCIGYWFDPDGKHALKLDLQGQRTAVGATIKQRGLLLSSSLSELYGGLASCNAALRQTKRVDLNQVVLEIELGLDAFLSALVGDLAIAIGALTGTSKVPENIEAHLLMRGPTPPTYSSVRVVARTVERPCADYSLTDIDREIPFPPAKSAFTDEFDRGCWVIGDVHEWARSWQVAHPNSKFARRWQEERKLRKRYGSAIVIQIKALDPRLCGGAWKDLTNGTVAVLCIDCHTKDQWDDGLREPIFALAAPYIATIRHVISHYGAVAMLRSQREGLSLFCDRTTVGRPSQTDRKTHGH